MTTYSSAGKGDRMDFGNLLRSTFPIIQAVVDGVQQGQIFVNSRYDCWVFHKAGFSEAFLKNDDGTELIDFIRTNNELPQYFHLYSPGEGIMAALNRHQNALNVRTRERIQLSYPAGSPLIEPVFDLGSGFKLEKVTNGNFESLAELNLGLDNKFWNDKHEFIDRAMGYIIEDDSGKAVSLCYAAAIAAQKAEIDVLTRSEYRGMGLAKSVVARFVSCCIENHVTPNWDCFADNIASLRTARSLGFNLDNNYRFVSIYKNKQL